LPFPDTDAQLSIVWELDGMLRAATQARRRAGELAAIKATQMQRILAA